jgi:hypothetical protein
MSKITQLSETLTSYGTPAVPIMDIDYAAGVINLRGTVQLAGTALSTSAATINKAVIGPAAGYAVARGQSTMTAATKTVVTGLSSVVAVIASMETDPILTCDRVTAQIGDQAGAPAAGSIILKVWMPTAAALTTPIAATGYANIVINWFAIGLA